MLCRPRPTTSAKANVSPSAVGLIEGHGTGTVAGDSAEVEALTQFFNSQGAEIQDCALGSVKSMIGHTKCTAGIAGIIKTIEEKLEKGEQIAGVG